MAARPIRAPKKIRHPGDACRLLRAEKGWSIQKLDDEIAKRHKRVGSLAMSIGRFERKGTSINFETLSMIFGALHDWPIENEMDNLVLRLLHTEQIDIVKVDE